MREGDALTRIALVACLRSHAPDVSAWMLSAEPEVPFITSPRRPRIARLLAEAGVEFRTYHCETATVACKCRREAQLRAGDDMIHSVPGPTPRRAAEGPTPRSGRPTADVAHHRVTAREDRRRKNLFETAHWPPPLFQKPMVALDAVGSIPPGPMQTIRRLLESRLLR